jgi:hypothetical protein
MVKPPKPKSSDQIGSRKDSASDRSQRLEAQLKTNIRKRKDQARARAEAKPDAPGFPGTVSGKDEA